MEKIILWGTGKIATRLLEVINDFIILVVDNDEKKWGDNWNGYIVNSPSSIKNFIGSFNRIVIATIEWKIVREQIIREFSIDSSLIDNMYYRQKKVLLECFEKDTDKKKYISFLKKHPLEVFNDDFTTKYIHKNPEVYFEQEKSLYYVLHNGKKMYFSSCFTTQEQVKRYYSFLLMEQDVASPHKYQTDNFCVSRHDVVLDAGVAEGNFALDIIDLVDKLYLVESDAEWIKALEYTFEPYRDKVKIIEGVLGGNSRNGVSLNDIIGNEKIDFIKMDIEGAEWKVLNDSKQLLNKKNIKLDICVYHNYDDEIRIKQLLDKIGYKTEVSDGYMIFITDEFYDKEVICPQFVRGLIRARKE